MPCEHLRALIQELHPDVSVRQLQRAAGLDPNRISYYLKPSTHLTQMPPTAACKEIAMALGCDLDLVVEAFAADVGLPWGPPIRDRVLARLLRRWRRMTPARRELEASRSTQELLDQWADLSSADRAALLATAKSLAWDSQ